MLTNKNWGLRPASTIRRFSALFISCVALLLVGCQPPGPKSLLLGQKYLEQGNYEKALKYLTRASELIPEHPQVWNHLGLAYHGSKQPDKAVEAYQRAIRINRNLPAPHYNLGVLLLEEQHLPQAVAELNTFCTLEPNSPEGWTKLGTALVRSKRPDHAEVALLNALRLDPKNSEAHNALGLAHIQRKRPREAMISFNNALQYHTGFAPALLNQAVIAHQHFGNKPMALERYRAFLSTQPDAKTAAQVQQVISTLEKEIEGVDVAQTDTAEVPPLRETNAFTALLRSNAPSKQAEATAQRPPAATNVAQRPAATKTNVATVATNVAVASARTNAPAPRATNSVAAAVTNAPATAVTNKVMVALAEKKPEPKEEPAPEPEPEPQPAQPEEPPAKLEVVNLEEPEFKPVADVAPQPVVAMAPASATNVVAERPLIVPRSQRKEEEKPGFFSRLNPARLFRDDDRTASKVDVATPEPEVTPPPARPSYQPPVRIPEAKPQPPRVIARYQYRRPGQLKAGNRAAAQKLFQAGSEAHQRRRLQEAVEAYQNATALDPSFYDAYYNLGIAAYQTRNLPLALSANERALAAKPASKDARYNFALTLREAHYPVDAANELRALLVDDPNEVRAHFALANIYAQQLDQPVLARKHYLTVLELNPSHPEAPTIRHWLAANQ